MRLTRVFIDSELRAGGVMELPPDTAAHVARVLRARAGDSLVLFNGEGGEFAGEVESVRGARVRVTIGARDDTDRESPLAVTLVQCVPRGDRMDFVVQKATELGVRRIIPVLSQRSVVRLDAAHAESRAAHWRAVSIGACEQCGRNRRPVIDAARALYDYLGEMAPAATSRLVLEPGPAPGRPPAVGAAVEIAVGPEGGFAPEELEAFRVSGFERVSLGPRILRSETAAVAALAWLQTRYGDMVPA